MKLPAIYFSLLFIMLLPQKVCAAEFSVLDNMLILDAVDAEGSLISANLRAQDEGPMVLGKRFILEQAGTSSADAPDAIWDPTTDQVLAPVVMEGSVVSHSLTLLRTGKEIWTVVKLISETLFNDGEDIKVVFMQGEAGPRGEPGLRGPRGRTGPVSTSPTFTNLTVTDTTTTDQLTVTGNASITGNASAAQVNVTGTVSAAEIDVTGDVTANRFIGNGSQLTNIKSLASYIQSDSILELSDTIAIAKEISITVPGPGIILVNSTGYAQWEGTGDDFARLSILDASWGDPNITFSARNHFFNNLMLLGDSGTSDITDRYDAWATQRGFIVSGAGTYTYRLWGDQFNSRGAAHRTSIGDANMTVMYFPTGN